MASHASRFVKTPALVASFVALGFAVCQLVVADASAATACSATPAGTVMTQTPNLECSGGAANCDPAIQPGVDPSTQSGVGPLTKCVFNGDDPPVTLRPDLGTGSGISFSGMGSTLQAGKCTPPIGLNGATVGTLSCPVTQVNNVPNVPAFTPTPNPNLSNPNTPLTPDCLSSTATSIPPLPCGGAASLLLNLQNLTGANNQIANSINFGGVSVGMPPTNITAGTQTVANTLANNVAGCGSNSFLSMPNNTVSLVLAPNPSASPLTQGSQQYPVATLQALSHMYLTSFTAPAEISWNTSASNANDIISLPNGGTYTNPQGDIVTFPDGAVLYNPGTGYVVWLNGGNLAPPTGGAAATLPVGSFPSVGTFDYSVSIGSAMQINISSSMPPGNTIASLCNGLTGTELTDCETDQYFVQQSPVLPGNEAEPLVTARTPQTYALLGNPSAEGAVFALKTCDSRGDCTVTDYLNGEYIPVGSTMLINAESEQTLTEPPQPTWTDTTVTPAAGSYLNIPLGTPVTLQMLGPTGTGSMLLPAGGTILGPDSSTVYTLPAGSTLTSLGNSQLELPDGTVLTYWPGDAYVRVNTTEVGIPAGTSIPMNTSATASTQINLPETAGTSPPASNSCGGSGSALISN
jgi:hypothetical protein